MRCGLCLALLWPSLAVAWEEEAALAFILAYHPVVAAQRHATTAYRPPKLGRQLLEHTSVFVRAASGTSTTMDFQKSKADWVQNRIRKGYEGDVEKLWETAQKQNAQAAALKKLDLLIDAQRRQVAHHAGEKWKPLLDCLSGKLGELPEG